MEEEQPILKSSSSSSIMTHRKGCAEEEEEDDHVHEHVTVDHNPFSSSISPSNNIQDVQPSAPQPLLAHAPAPAPAPAPPPDDQLSVSKSLVLLNTTNSTENLEGATDASPACSTVSFTPGSLNREIVLAKLNQEKVLSLIKAWEDNVKAKSLNRFGKKLTKISAWEKAKKARAEAHLQALEEKLEKKKAAFVESVQNEIAAVHMKAEEERALAEAHHGEETLKAEEVAAKYRASGKFPRKYALCFGV